MPDLPVGFDPCPRCLAIPLYRGFCSFSSKDLHPDILEPLIVLVTTVLGSREFGRHEFSLQGERLPVQGEHMAPASLCVNRCRLATDKPVTLVPQPVLEALDQAEHPAIVQLVPQ